MSTEVTRYDAVHIRYEDNNIRYDEGCEIEVVTAADYEREVMIAIAAGQRMQDERDALHAEAEALRAQRDKMAQILRDLVPGCKWRFMRPRIDQALQEVDGGNQ